MSKSKMKQFYYVQVVFIADSVTPGPWDCLVKYLGSVDHDSLDTATLLDSHVCMCLFDTFEEAHAAEVSLHASNREDIEVNICILQCMELTSQGHDLLIEDD